MLAREIALIRSLDREGKIKYQRETAKEMARYSDRYLPVNQSMIDTLGVKILNDPSGNPSFVNTLKKVPKAKGLAHIDEIWVNPDTSSYHKVLNYELAHVAFGHRLKNTPVPIAEVQAEGTTYIVGGRLGIPTEVLAKSSAPVLYTRMGDYSPEQIDNMMNANRRAIIEVANSFVGGRRIASQANYLY